MFVTLDIAQVCRALSFLNNDAKLKHNNLHAASVFVTPAGDWKLAGLESVCGVDHDPPLQILPSCNKYCAPERGDQSKGQF